jgi:hypothetical protein
MKTNKYVVLCWKCREIRALGSMSQARVTATVHAMTHHRRRDPLAAGVEVISIESLRHDGSGTGAFVQD